MPGVLERFLNLFRGRSEKRQIDLLTERRARLTAKRELLYSEIQRLERREKELLEQGRESESNAQKRRLATQLAHLRKDLDRRNTAANVLSRNIDILTTHIHHLDLIDSVKDAHLPDANDINNAAVQVDELITRIKEESDLITGIEADRSQELISAEETSILAEFERARDAELASRQLQLDEVVKPASEKSALEKTGTETKLTQKTATDEVANVATVKLTSDTGTSETTIGQKTVEKPIVEKPTVEKPIVEKPTVEKPIVEKPTVEKPTVGHPVLAGLGHPKVETTVVIAKPVGEVTGSAGLHREETRREEARRAVEE